MNRRQVQFYSLYKEIAKKRGGKLLSEKYVNCETKLWFECAFKHQWETSPPTVKRGSWCPECNGTSPSKGRQTLIQNVQTKGGRVIGEYINCETPVLIECASGHQWSTTPDQIRAGSWCTRCNDKSTDQAQENFERVIESFGGSVVGPYKNNHTAVTVRCINGHLITTVPSCTRRTGYQLRCDVCSGEEFKNEFVQMVGKNKGKICEEFQGNWVKITVECEKGHKWRVVPISVRLGRWCPICNESQLEREARLLLECHGINYEREYVVPQLPNKRFDFYFRFCGQDVLLELDGEQHFSFVPRFHGTIDEFHLKQNYDRLKTRVAIDFGYKLIRIDYTQIGNIKDHLLRALNDLNTIYLSTPMKYLFLYENIPFDLVLLHSPQLASKHGITVS